MAKTKKKILIVEARFYDEIADALATGAAATLSKANYDHERLAVPGVFEIPNAIRLAWNTGAYAGILALGCVIRGETDHYDHICREVSRKLMDLSVDYAMPHGFGILTCENKDQAWERADMAQRNLGGRTAEACLRMIDIKLGFPE